MGNEKQVDKSVEETNITHSASEQQWQIYTTNPKIDRIRSTSLLARLVLSSVF